MNTSSPSGKLDQATYWSISNIVYMFLAVVCFLLSIDMLGLGLSQFAGSSAAQLTSATDNPFIGLFIGLLITAVLQSSSTTTSLAVAAVASGSITLESAIPVILGANIGTTITSTIVAFGFITKAKEFRRAVSASMIHDMFNIIGVLIIFPLEIKYHFLQRASYFIASSIPVTSDDTTHFWVGRAFDYVGEGLLSVTGSIVFVILSVLLLFGSIKMLSKLLYTHLVGTHQEQFQNIVFKNPRRAFGWGILMTAIVQSSSLTTSLIVPLVATDKVRLERAFNFLMGANIGTTITAILAALFRSEAAMSLAIAHFLFNLTAVLIYVSIPIIGRLPLYLAEKLGYLMFRYRIAAFAYITLVFFVIPFTLIYFSKSDQRPSPPPIDKVKKLNEP